MLFRPKKHTKHSASIAMELYRAKCPVFLVTVFMVTKTVKFLFEMNNPWSNRKCASIV